MRFDKSPKTLDEQIDLLESRGLVIDDRQRARHYLAHLNYYRLTAYWLPFEADHGCHRFEPGSRFDAVLNLYIFDRELRLLVLDAIERVEVSLRTQWAYQVAHCHGPHAHLDPMLAKNRDWWHRNLESLREEIERSDEIFIQHYRTSYDDPHLPPVWAVCELMSLGLLSRWFTNLKPMKTRSAIARTYGLDEKVLQAFIRHLSYIRNLCAHHSRLWNRRFTVTMELPRSKPTELLASFHPVEDRLLYNTLVMLGWLLDRISPGHHWKRRLLELIERHAVKSELMGFPDDFERRSIWQLVDKGRA